MTPAPSKPAPFLLWLLLAGAGSGCRAFPISLYVPDETLDALEESEYVERLDPQEIRRRIDEAFGFDGAPAPDDPRTYRRIDCDPPSGPFEPEAWNAVGQGLLDDARPGDLLLAKNAKPQSLGQTLTFEEFTFYSHMGVLAEEEGRYWVYESWPRLDLFGRAEDFAARFRGGVQRVPIGEFLNRYETVALVRLAGGEDLGERLAAAARASLAENIPYDPHHDPDDPAMSCSEYVCYLLQDKLDHPLPVRPRQVTRNPSMQKLLHSLGFRTDRYVVPDSFEELEGSELVALVSRQPDLAAFQGKRLAYRALHAHFVANSTVASYLGIDRWHLVRYRPNVEDFLHWAVAYARAHPDEAPGDLGRDLERMVEIFFRRRSEAALP